MAFENELDRLHNSFKTSIDFIIQKRKNNCFQHEHHYLQLRFTTPISLSRMLRALILDSQKLIPKCPSGY